MIKHTTNQSLEKAVNPHMQVLAIREGVANLPDPSDPISKSMCRTLQEKQFKG